jgi:hypothetical protein
MRSVSFCFESCAETEFIRVCFKPFTGGKQTRLTPMRPERAGHDVFSPFWFRSSGAQVKDWQDSAQIRHGLTNFVGIVPQKNAAFD